MSSQRATALAIDRMTFPLLLMMLGPITETVVPRFRASNAEPPATHCKVSHLQCMRVVAPRYCPAADFKVADCCRGAGISRIRLRRILSNVGATGMAYLRQMHGGATVVFLGGVAWTITRKNKDW